MTQLPTDDEVARYRADGAVCLRGAFSLDWIERLRAAVDDDMANPGPMVRLNTPAGAPGLFFVDFQLWQRHAGARDFVFESPARDIAARLMGSREVVYYHDHLLVKEPGTRERTPWHHDQPYYPIDGEQIVSLWLPLDPVDRATCVEVLPPGRRRSRRPGCPLRAVAGSRCRTRAARVPRLGYGARRCHRLPCAHPARRLGQSVDGAAAPCLGDAVVRRRCALCGAGRPDFATARGAWAGAGRSAGLRDVPEGARLEHIPVGGGTAERNVPLAATNPGARALDLMEPRAVPSDREAP